MSDSQRQTQLDNIQAASGISVAEFGQAVQRAELERHGEIVAFLKREYGLTHGNANLIAHVVREELAGGPAAPGDLLEAQYAGAKSGLRPIYDALLATAEGLGADVDVVVQKTGGSFRRRKQFAVVQAGSAKRVQVGLNLPATPSDQRVKAVSGMCSHRVDLTALEDLDDAVRGWISEAYVAAG
jgi:hypothetical protein